MKSNCIYCDRVFNAESFQVDLFCNKSFVTKYIKICPICENEANEKARKFVKDYSVIFDEREQKYTVVPKHFSYATAGGQL